MNLIDTMYVLWAGPLVDSKGDIDRGIQLHLTMVDRT